MEGRILFAAQIKQRRASAQKKMQAFSSLASYGVRTLRVLALHRI